MTDAARSFRPMSRNGPGIGRHAGTRNAFMEAGRSMAVQEVVAARGAVASRTPVIAVEGLKKHFPVKKGLLRRTAGYVYAVDGVSFSVGEGETLGLVGESGCGKSTAGKTILRLIEPTAGAIKIRGENIEHLPAQAMRPYRRQMQVVFQDPYSSLNPRLSVGDIVAEPLANYGLARGAALKERVAEILAKVGLRTEAMRRYPHEFSGGQRQRIGIARALAVNPG